MKTSPLQLKWVAYPSISFQAIPNVPNDSPVAAIATGTVVYSLDGSHTAILDLKSASSDAHAYEFSLSVLAVFTFDLNVAKLTYVGPSESLPRTIAVNLSRVLYSGAREMLALITARAPLGSVILDSVLLEKSDIKIQSDSGEEEILLKHFGIIKAPPQTESVTMSPAAAANRKKLAKAKK